MRPALRYALSAILVAATAAQALPADPRRADAPPPDAAAANRLAAARRQARLGDVAARAVADAARRADEEAERLRVRSAHVAVRVQQAEAVLDAAAGRLSVIDRLLAARRASLAMERDRAVRLVAALQVMARRPAVLALMHPATVQDSAHVATVLDAMLPVVQARTAALRSQIAALHLARARAVRARGEVAAAGQRLAAARRLLDKAEAQRHAQAEALAGDAADEQRRAQVLAARVSSLARLIEGVAPAPRLPVTKPPADPHFIMPTAGEVALRFGEVSDSGVRSRGVTLHTRPAALITAPAGGRIAFAGPFRDYGQIVIIQHDGGWTSLLTGLSRLDTHVGDRVAASGPVGRMGDSAPMLTVELRHNGRTMNPLPLLNREN